MNGDLTQLLTPTWVFMFACYLITMGIRKVAELRRPSLTTSIDWNDIVLPAMPPALGMLIAIIPSAVSILPAVFIKTWFSKVIFGFVAGAMSTWAFKIVKAIVKKFIGSDPDKDSRRPDPMPGLHPQIPPPPPMPSGPNLAVVTDIQTPVQAVSVEKKP